MTTGIVVPTRKLRTLRAPSGDPCRAETGAAIIGHAVRMRTLRDRGLRPLGVYPECRPRPAAPETMALTPGASNPAHPAQSHEAAAPLSALGP